MSGDPDLQLRGRLLRRLGLLREMLPGSFVEHKRACGRPNCHCADGKPKSFHIPKALVDEVREKIQLRQRFEAAAAAICRINLRRFLKEKDKS